MAAVKETFVPPASSNIASFTYDPDTNALEVEFVSGDVYSYAGVDMMTVRRWQQNGGSGSFFYRNIRDRFPYEQQ